MVYLFSDSDILHEKCIFQNYYFLPLITSFVIMYLPSAFWFKKVNQDIFKTYFAMWFFFKLHQSFDLYDFDVVNYNMKDNNFY